MCYATSQDGIHWEKPELGLIDFDGSKQKMFRQKGTGRARMGSITSPSRVGGGEALAGVGAALADLDAGAVAAGLSAMTSGLWLDMLTNPRSMSRQDAKMICMRFLATTFDRHFTPAGSIRQARDKRAS